MELSEAQPENMKFFTSYTNSELHNKSIDTQIIHNHYTDFAEKLELPLNDMSIVKARPEDFDDIFYLLEQQFWEHKIELPRETLTYAINEVLHNENLGVFYVLKEEGASIGMAEICFVWTLEHGGKSAWLDEFYIITDKRGNKRGTFFLRAIIDEMKKEGFRAIDLEVEQGHQQAEHLYSREGFQKHARSRWVLKL